MRPCPKRTKRKYHEDTMRTLLLLEKVELYCLAIILHREITHICKLHSCKQKTKVYDSSLDTGHGRIYPSFLKIFWDLFSDIPCLENSRSLMMSVIVLATSLSLSCPTLTGFLCHQSV